MRRETTRCRTYKAIGVFKSYQNLLSIYLLYLQRLSKRTESKDSFARRKLIKVSCETESESIRGRNRSASQQQIKRCSAAKKT